jgi:hypothetical protein
MVVNRLLKGLINSCIAPRASMVNCQNIFFQIQVRGDQEGLFKLVTLNCILNRITGVTFG